MTALARRGEAIRLAMAGEAPIPSKVVCAWCGALVRAGREPVSHGICEHCLAIQNTALDREEGRP